MWRGTKLWKNLAFTTLPLKNSLPEETDGSSFYLRRSSRIVNYSDYYAEDKQCYFIQFFK